MQPKLRLEKSRQPSPYVEGVESRFSSNDDYNGSIRAKSGPPRSLSSRSLKPVPTFNRLVTGEYASAENPNQNSTSRGNRFLFCPDSLVLR
jgi:hypothetical protein